LFSGQCAWLPCHPTIVNQFRLIRIGITGLVLYNYALKYSASFLRWLQPSWDFQELRKNVISTLRGEKNFRRNNGYKPIGTGVRFKIFFNKADEFVARIIKRTFIGFGHYYAKHINQADKFIILVSNLSSVKDIQDYGVRYGNNAVFILISPIVDKNLKGEALQYQWVDFRNLEISTMDLLAATLVDRDLYKREFALEVLPKPFGDFRAPAEIVELREQIVLLVGSFFLMSLDFVFILPWYVIINLIFGMVIIFFVENILGRRMNAKETRSALVFIGIIYGVSLGLSNPFSIIPMVFWLNTIWSLARKGEIWFPNMSDSSLVDDPIGAPLLNRKVLLLSVVMQLVGGIGLSLLNPLILR